MSKSALRSGRERVVAALLRRAPLEKMIFLLLPLVLFGCAFVVALETGPHRSAEARRWPPRVVRLATVGLNLVALAWHLYASAKLRPIVHASAGPGTVVYGGPGDGLVMLFMVALPWLVMQITNLPLAWAASATIRQFVAFWGLLLGCWLAAGYVGSMLMECPPGIVCAGG